MNQRNDNVKYELAEKLKEAGFDWKSNFFYNTDYPDNPAEYSLIAFNYNDSNVKKTLSAPSYEMVLDWLFLTFGCKITINRHIMNDQVIHSANIKDLANRELQTFILKNYSAHATQGKENSIAPVIVNVLSFFTSTTNEREKN